MFKAETNRWIKIQYTRKGNPFFYHKGKRISFHLIVSCHNNPWLGTTHFPDYIHGYKADEYFNPMFIEINRTGTAVKVYRKVA